ncbi:nitrate- and nitrite sensing domain-containing protein [Thalassomonas viridans]|uniref:Nitrate- and nitrite sensing domain-containing protein n=1 Tax=Thalassomonas viridans TaxID=137584 RepID=A0AAE9YYC7_9GAMM|nr:nitrate- and nitrite sensing domain-containing protein [Thalassomonas viridans]WDE03486.1 nitrate- and nitrite sensing domain-containing protein [Thalassomonas viridans]
MSVFHRLKFKHKLFLLLLVPLLGFLYFSLSHLLEVNNQLANARNVEKLLSVTVKNNALVHELQKERGMTAIVLSSRGQKYTRELQEQRRRTDLVHSELARGLTDFTSENAKINQIISEIKTDLDLLTGVRSRITNLDISTREAIAFYTKLNDEILQLTGFFITMSPKETVPLAIGYYNFLEAKERAGIERAVVSGGFSAGVFTRESYQKFIRLNAVQETYLQQFLLNTPETLKNDYLQKMQAPSAKQVVDYRRQVIEKGPQGPFTADAGDWFKAATDKINLFKQVEDNISAMFIEQIKQLSDKANNTMILTALFLLFSVCLTLFIAGVILKNLLKQLKLLTQTISSVRDSHDLTARVQVISADELGQLSHALNETLMTFAGAVEQISSSSIELSASAEQSATTVEKNALSLQHQQNETAQVATAIEEMSVSVQEVARNTANAMSAARQANQQAINGQQVVSDSLNTINTLAREVSDIGELISGLHTTSGTIAGVIDVIKGVAEQTNLLALNAAIEAARAGEQGRGFAVVADEVRTLAQRTQESTVEIENIIQQLQNEAGNAYRVIEGSQARAQETVKDTGKIELSLTEIVTSISDINAMVEQIAVAAEEQVNVTNEINQNISDIDHKSQEVTIGAQEVSDVASSQVLLANNLQDLAAKFAI